MPQVWLAQCLCPHRHAILAAAHVADDEEDAEARVRQPLQAQVEAMLAAGAINPWCGLCQAPVATWRYELTGTAFRSLREAMPALRYSEREQAIIREAFGR